MTTISASIDLQLGQYGGLFGRVGIYGWKPDQADLYVFRYPGNTLVQYHDADYAYEDRGEASGWGRARTQRVLGTGRERALFKIAPLDTFRGAVCPLHWGTYEMREVAAARIRAGNGPPPECRRADFTDVVALANGPPLQRLAFVWAWEARAFAKDAVRSLLRRGIAVKVITVGLLEAIEARLLAASAWEECLELRRAECSAGKSSSDCPPFPNPSTGGRSQL